MFVGTEENQIAVFCTDALKNRSAHRNWQVFYDWRLQAFFKIGLVVNLDVSQTFSAVDADKFGVVVNLLTGQFLVTARHFKRGNAGFRVVSRASEDFEIYFGNQIFYIDQF